MTAISSFIAPATATSGVNFTMQATSTKAGTVVYKLGNDANATFGNGQKEIRKPINAHSTDTTQASLVGAPAIVTVKASLDGEVDGRNRNIFLS
jgi:hypothetical protein